jgi:hypothetical protein
LGLPADALTEVAVTGTEQHPPDDEPATSTALFSQFECNAMLGVPYGTPSQTEASWARRASHSSAVMA